MNKHLFLLVILSLWGAMTQPSAVFPVSAAANIKALRLTGAATGMVSAIVDGDTFFIDIKGKRVRVRLAQIDAPERGQAFDRRSEQSLRDMVWKKKVAISWSNLDREGQPVVEAVADGVNVNAEQIKRGMAWVYRNHVTNQALYVLEQDAVGNERGLWSDPQPIPPWNWRDGMKTLDKAN